MSNWSDPKGRRAAPRVAARVRVRFRSVEELVTAYTHDISRGGLYVATAKQLPAGSHVEVWLELPDGGPPARIIARVAYALTDEQAAPSGRQAGMGMELVDADTTKLGDRIASFLGQSLIEETGAAQRALHVLVASSSPELRARFTTLLEGAGHRVTRAMHGLDALGKALKEPPDVVLAEIAMDMVDGWQLVRLLRAQGGVEHVPVALVARSIVADDRIRGYELGVDDIVSLDLPPDELLVRLAGVAARGRDRRGETGMTGTLDQVSVISLLAFVEAERRSGVLVVTSRNMQSVVHLSDGAVVAADVPDAPAGASVFERLQRVLDWTQGRFVFRPASPGVAPDGDRVSIQGALLEHARRQDEGGR